MKPTFEQRLTERCGAEQLKAAKQLLKNQTLQGVWRDVDGHLWGRFYTPGAPAFECRVTPGDQASSQCSCNSEYPLCAHGAALLLYNGFVAGRRRLGVEPPPAYYRGLKQEDFATLIRRCRPQQAHLEIEVYATSPHAPSKWENITVGVALYGENERKYLGNLSNLRKLYFDKNLNVVLRYEQFSLQEQQIIRFLATYGELDGPRLTLDAGASAEFFQVLIGFPRFFRDGKALKINGTPATPALISRRGKLYPALSVGGAVLALNQPKVITGRSGCWVGQGAEYFFVPAICELSFLRNFFRAGAHSVPSGVTEAEYLQDFPFPVVTSGAIEPAMLEPVILLDGKLATDQLVLSVEYLYRRGEASYLCGPFSGALLRDERRFYRRDRELELQFETALELFGFELTPHGATLDGAENFDRIGFFLDRVLPDYLRKYPQLSLGATLAALCRGGQGVEPVSLHCRAAEKSVSAWRIDYELTSGGEYVEWQDVEAIARRYGAYFRTPLGRVGGIGAAAGKFFRSVGNAITHRGKPESAFDLPLCNVGYFQQLAAELPGAVPPEIITNSAPEILPEAPDFHFEGELRAYQKSGVSFLQWMTDRDFNVILADEMGLGKTVQVLALLASRLKRRGEPALVVCPASLVVNWEREAAKFVPQLRVLAPQGAERSKLLKKRSECDLLILSYTAARLGREELRDWQFSYVILDEAQHIKNPGSGNAKNCKSLQGRHRLVLSGTPLENSPEDLWSVMDFLQPGMLGTLADFRRRYAGIADNAELREDLAMRISPFIKRRTKAEVAADLPGKSERILYCEFTPGQRRLYEEVLSEGRRKIANLRSGDKRANAMIFNTLLRLRQICCNPELLPDKIGAGVPSAKQELLFELLDETIDSNHKVLLFSQFTSLLQSLIPELERRGIRYEYLDGATTKRQTHVDNFNGDPEIMLFLLSIKAGGTGLNLTSADRVIIYDPWWNPAVELQAADRTHRIGQTRSVLTTKLVVKDSVEEKILALQGRKRRLFDALVEAPAATNLTLDELRFLLEES